MTYLTETTAPRTQIPFSFIPLFFFFFFFLLLQLPHSRKRKREIAAIPSNINHTINLLDYARKYRFPIRPNSHRDHSSTVTTVCVSEVTHECRTMPSWTFTWCRQSVVVSLKILNMNSASHARRFVINRGACKNIFVSYGPECANNKWYFCWFFFSSKEFCYLKFNHCSNQILRSTQVATTYNVIHALLSLCFLVIKGVISERRKLTYMYKLM